MQPIKHSTLCLVINKQITPNKILMILKGRGMGMGKFNFPGGKLDANETSQECAVRECFEETGITPTSLTEIGLLEFVFPPESTKSWSNHCKVFISTDFSGQIQAATEECEAFWRPIDQIPFAQMWETDREWLPKALAGEKFYIRYEFDINDKLIKK